MTHFNFQNLDWDEALKKLHLFILKAFCYIVGAMELAFLFFISIFFWKQFLPSWYAFFSISFGYVFFARLICTGYLIKKIPPITDKPKRIFHITLLLAALVLISNIFIIIDTYEPPSEKKIFSWLDKFSFLYITSFTGYVALIHSIQLFHPNKRKSLIINIITSLMMIYWLVDFFIIK